MDLEIEEDLDLGDLDIGDKSFFYFLYEFYYFFEWVFF